MRHLYMEEKRYNIMSHSIQTYRKYVYRLILQGYISFRNLHTILHLVLQYKYVIYEYIELTMITII